jgi:hypothetical protein
MSCFILSMRAPMILLRLGLWFSSSVACWAFWSRDWSVEMDVPKWDVANLKQRRQNIKDWRDCSDMEAVRPPVEISTFCHRLEADGDVDSGNDSFGDFSGVEYL